MLGPDNWNGGIFVKIWSCSVIFDALHTKVTPHSFTFGQALFKSLDKHGGKEKSKQNHMRNSSYGCAWYFYLVHKIKGSDSLLTVLSAKWYYNMLFPILPHEDDIIK